MSQASQTPGPDLHRLLHRPATRVDLEYLLQLVRTTMRSYTEATFGHWDEEAVRQKFQASIEEGGWQLLELEGAPLGAMRVLHQADFIQLDQIFLEPDSQGQGWGSALVRELLRQADEQGLAVRLRVLRSNPARELYLRLGFQVERETAERWFMVHPPPR